MCSILLLVFVHGVHVSPTIHLKSELGCEECKMERTTLIMMAVVIMHTG